MCNIDLLSIERGSVTAPAGCGKTQLIAESLKGHSGDTPVLILTHTNAGVAALRSRLNSAGVSSNSYRLATIDGWALRLIGTFPSRSGHHPRLLEIQNPGADYRQIRLMAAGLLDGGHVNDIIVASYSRLLVDEYQDSTDDQHAIVSSLAQSLPTCVLGDPMQAIFGFGDNVLPNWERDVCEVFPTAGVLTKPWRWIQADSEELGEWLLDVRIKLSQGLPIDLAARPAAVRWIELDGPGDRKKQLAAARERPPGGEGKVLIIALSTDPRAQRKFASQTPGAVTVEAVDLKDFISFARGFCLESESALPELVSFGQSVMSNAGGAHLLQRVEILKRGTQRKPASSVELTSLAFLRAPTANAAIDVLVEMNKQGGVRVYRPVVLRACIKALKLCSFDSSLSLYDAASRVREENRALGRALPRRAVGSTLLLKGLEAEVAVVLNGDELSVQNLYVAMTRGSKALTICSTSRVLNQNLAGRRRWRRR